MKHIYITSSGTFYMQDTHDKVFGFYGNAGANMMNGVVRTYASHIDVKIPAQDLTDILSMLYRKLKEDENISEV